MLGVDKGSQATQPLRLCNHLQGDGCLAGGLGAKYLRDAAARDSTDAESCVKADGSGGDDGKWGEEPPWIRGARWSLCQLLFNLCEC